MWGSRMKATNYHCSIYKPNQGEKKQLAATLIRLKERLVYKKLKSGKYKTYCCRCNSYHVVSKEELNHIRAAKVCPNCLRKVETGTRQVEKIWDWISVDKPGAYYGYRIMVEWVFGKQPKVVSLKQVLYYNEYEGVTYRNNCVKCMGYHITVTNTNGWRKCVDSTYWGFFYSINLKDNNRYEEPKTKKEYYESICEEFRFFDIKSNQQKLIQNNLFNANQIACILKFNLKTAEDVYKYTPWINKNNLNYHQNKQNLNIYFLDYLSRNKINYVDWIDYEEQCELLGMKLDKPKDFETKHQMFAVVLKAKRNKEYEGRIAKRYKECKQYSYHQGKYNINPFRTPSEIIECGKVLHNCIAQYIERYAKKQTYLLYMKVENEYVAAIEFRGGMIVQARTNFNRKLNTTQKWHLNKWCKQNGWLIRT